MSPGTLGAKWLITCPTSPRNGEVLAKCQIRFAVAPAEAQKDELNVMSLGQSQPGLLTYPYRTFKNLQEALGVLHMKLNIYIYIYKFIIES